MNTRRSALRRALLAHGALLIGAGWTCAPALAQSTGSAPAIEEVVVTAQKRSESLQSVPVAVTALTSEEIEANRVQNVGDISALAPGLSIRPSPGGALIPNLSMRGIFGVAPAGADRGVGLYIDGVYVNSAVGSAFDVADIERIEVLRGPQGTLFGRNSLGGAINVITSDPTGEFGVRQEFSYGNYDQFRSKTHVELPAFGKLTASFTYLHSEREGDVRNLGAGTVWDYSTATNGALGHLTSPKHLGDQDVNAVAATVKFEAASNLNFTYKFDWSDNHYTPDAIGVQLIDPGPENASINTLLAIQPDPSILTPITNKRPDAVNNAYSLTGELQTQDHMLLAEYNASDNLTFKNTLAYRKSDLSVAQQLDGLGGLVVGGTPLVLVADNAGSKEHQWSDELQANFDTSWLSLTTGLLYYDVRTQAGIPDLPPQQVDAFLPGYKLNYTGAQPSKIHVVSEAAYIQSTFHLTDKLDLQLGARMTWDRKSGLDTTLNTSPVNISYKGSQPTYLAGLNYKFADDILGYVKYSTGYISGGELATLTFKPSKAQSYEAGLKADWFDHTLRTDLAVYHADYKALQITLSGEDFVPVIPASEVLVNAANARANGVEFETTFVPTEGLTLTGNVAYTGFKYTSLNPALLLAGPGPFRPPAEPTWTSDVSAQYETPQVWRGGHVVFRMDANYTSKQFAEDDQLWPTVLATNVPNTLLVNGRLALEGVSLNSGGAEAEIAIWAKNLTNNRSISTGADFTILNAVIYQPARTFGVDLNVEF